MSINLNNFEELALPVLSKLAESFPTFLGASALPGEGDERNDVLSILQNQDLIFCNNKSCFQLTTAGAKLFFCSFSISLKSKLKIVSSEDSA